MKEEQTMKKNRLFMMAGALCAALGLGSCSKEMDEVAVPAEGATRTVTLTVSLPDRGADTRTAYAPDVAGLKVTWADGDELTAFGKDLAKSTTFKLTSVVDETTATFTGELPEDVVDEDIVEFYYPKFKTEVIDGETHYICPDYTAQDGTLVGLSKVDAFVLRAQYSDGKLSVNPSYTYRYPSFLHFAKDTKVASTGGTATFTISNANAVYDLTAGEFIKGNIVVDNVTVNADGKLADDVYIAFEKGDNVTPTLTIAVGSEKNVYSLDKEFAPGTMYNISDMSKLTVAPLTIEALAAGTITIKNPLGLEISYKLNSNDMVTSTTDITIKNLAAGDKVQLFGDNLTYGSEGDYNTNIKCSGPSKVYGNIMSLINSDNYSTLMELPTTDSEDKTVAYTFKSLFDGNTGLTDASGLILPATTLAKNCYETMFAECTSLTTAPMLPAETLAESCYFAMFAQCNALTTAPVLPAPKLEKNCYQAMFLNCTSLTTAPELPATTLAEGCYINMFYGCTALTTAPALPATTLAEGCYNSMFTECTALTTAPALPATTLAGYCYGGMFNGCKSLTTAPELSATTLAEGCYFNMFKGCTALTQAPALPATTLKNHCYSDMFSGCTSLKDAPALPATTLAKNCYYGMFSDCTSLTTAPELKTSILVEGCYEGMFYGCTSLNSVTCLATDISAAHCTANWLDGVAASGTFTKAASMTSWTTGENGIPSGWTVQ